MVENLVDGKKMERKQCSSTKVERKIIEKNRRNNMKTLNNKLYSLLPRNSSKEPLSVPDQIDEAVNYIKSLEAKLKKSREKKENLMGRKRSYACTTTDQSIASLQSPQIEIHQMGSSLKVDLTSGVDHQFMFNEIICMLHQEGLEVVYANYSVVGNSIFHVIHAQIAESMFGFGSAAKICERLNKFVYGCTSNEDELQPDSWDFEIHPQMWNF